MAVLTKPGDAWQEPEHIQIQNPDGVLRDVEVVRAKIGGEYVDVWPEDALFGDYNFRQAEILNDFTQQTNGFGYLYTDSYGLKPKFTSNLVGENYSCMSIERENKQQIELTDFLLKLKFYLGKSSSNMGVVSFFARDSNEKETFYIQISDAWNSSANQSTTCYIDTKNGTRLSFLSVVDKAQYYSGEWELKSLNGIITLKINGIVIATKTLNEKVCIKKIGITFAKYSTRPLNDMYVESLSFKKI